MSATIFTSVYANGGRSSRYTEFTVIYMHACTFITTPMEFMQASNWARGRMSSGNPVRDRTAFVEHIETVLARAGAGIATKGNKSILSRIVKSMKANAMFMEEWSIPHNLDEGVEVRKKPPAVVPLVKAAVAAVAAVAPLIVGAAPELAAGTLPK